MFKFIITFILTIVAAILTIKLRNFYGIAFYPWYEVTMLGLGVCVGIILSWKPNAY